MSSFNDAVGMTEEQWGDYVLQGMLESRRNSVVQVDALLAAGWSFELPEIVNHNPPKHDWSKVATEPWQWYWRSPAKRIGKKGRRYLSTNQAFNAMVSNDLIGQIGSPDGD